MKEILYTVFVCFFIISLMRLFSFLLLVIMDLISFGMLLLVITVILFIVMYCFYLSIHFYPTALRL